MAVAGIVGKTNLKYKETERGQSLAEGTDEVFRERKKGREKQE